MKNRLRKLIFWLLPIVILYLVFKKIDVELLRENLKLIDLKWLLIALLMHPALIILGAMRWNYQLAYYRVNERQKFSKVLKLYWAGMPIVMLFPSGLGWDAFRIIKTSSRIEDYALNSGVILLEKMATLVAAMLVVVLAFPFASNLAESAILQQVFDLVFLLLFFALGTSVLVLAFSHSKALMNWRSSFKSFVIRAGQPMIRKIAPSQDRSRISESARYLVRPFTAPRIVTNVLLFSIGMQVTFVLGAYFAFLAAAFQVPFFVTLLVIPIIFLAILVPVTVGGMGVREASYVLLFSQFGVPAETALIASFVAFLSMIVSYFIGILLWFLSPQTSDGQVNQNMDT